MLIIQVHSGHADDVESAFKDWHAGLTPLEWRDVAALERLLGGAGADAADLSHVHFRVEQRFVVS